MSEDTKPKRAPRPRAKVTKRKAVTKKKVTAKRKPATKRKTTARRKGVGTGKRKGKNGRPCLLTPEVHAAICEQVSKCVPLKLAAAMAGVSYDAANEWVARGGDPQESDPRFAQFRRGMADAKGQSVRELADSIRMASKIPSNITGQLDWKAASWLLERVDKEHFSQQSTSKLEVTGKEGGPLDFGKLFSHAAEQLDKIERGEIDPDKDDEP